MEYDPKLEAEMVINNTYGSAKIWLDSLENYRQEDGSFKQWGDVKGHKHPKQEHLEAALSQAPVEIQKFFDAYDKFPQFAENETYRSWAEDLQKRGSELNLDFTRSSDEVAEEVEV